MAYQIGLNFCVESYDITVMMMLVHIFINGEISTTNMAAIVAILKIDAELLVRSSWNFVLSPRSSGSFWFVQMTILTSSIQVAAMATILK